MYNVWSQPRTVVVRPLIFDHTFHVTRWWISFIIKRDANDKKCNAKKCNVELVWNPKSMILSIRITYIFRIKMTHTTHRVFHKNQFTDTHYIWTHWRCNAQNHLTRLLYNMSFLVKIESGTNHKVHIVNQRLLYFQCLILSPKS